VRRLGTVAGHHTVGYYQSTLRHAFFLPRTDPFFRKVQARLAKGMLEDVATARSELAARARHRDGDPAEVLDYHLFAADALAHAAKRIAYFGEGGRSTARERSALHREQRALRDRFERLWLARNRRSEIRITLRAYDRVAKEEV